MKIMKSVLIGNNEEKIFVYKLTSDDGGAPCVYNNKLSLCICKPRIRKYAKKNDWIIGFGGRNVYDLSNGLIYIAQVTEKLSAGDYFKKTEYADRPDCIYKWKEPDRIFEFKKRAIFHNEDCLEHDLGEYPNYNRAFSLLSDKFVYLGKTPVDRYKPLFDKIKPIYKSLPRDFKSNFSLEENKSLNEFIKGIIECFGFGKKGEPTHTDTTKKCNTCEGHA